MGKLFGTDGVRGKANIYPITPEVALQMGKAVASVFEASGHGSKRAVIGKDTRLSGYMLETALTSGMVSMGMDVYLVGPMPTPAVAHLTRSMAAACGLMITASHNPATDNGIKIFNSDGFKLRDELEARIEDLILGGEISTKHITYDQIGKAHRIEDARGRYVEFAKSSIGSRNLNGLRIVLDCANGASYFLGPLIFRELGAEVIKVGVEPDGYNINRDCGALYLDQLQEKVKEYRADIGIAFDGDADRVMIVDNDGTVVNGNQLIGLLAAELKAQGQLHNDTIAVTVMSNLGLYRAMEKIGVKIVTTSVGDRHVIEAMRDQDLSFGGEDSGHLIFMDYATTGDGIISALQLLKILKKSGKSLKELKGLVELFPNKLVNLEVAEKKPLEDVGAIQDVLRECEKALGDSGRHLLRYSGTENKIRVFVEAHSTKDVELWTSKIADVVKKELC